MTCPFEAAAPRRRARINPERSSILMIFTGTSKFFTQFSNVDLRKSATCNKNLPGSFETVLRHRSDTTAQMRTQHTEMVVNSCGHFLQWVHEGQRLHECINVQRLKPVTWLTKIRMKQKINTSNSNGETKPHWQRQAPSVSYFAFTWTKKEKKKTSIHKVIQISNRMSS